MTQTNIVLIMTDQLRADCLGYAGHPDVKTSYLDTLASEWVVFDRAYSACPSCIPSHQLGYRQKSGLFEAQRSGETVFAYGFVPKASPAL